MRDYTAFAQDWEAGWNSHDLDRIMAHYCDDIVFRSRKAVPLTGVGELRGYEALRAYWAVALKRQPDLRFEVVDVFEGHEMLVISYKNHRRLGDRDALLQRGRQRVSGSRLPSVGR